MHTRYVLLVQGDNWITANRNGNPSQGILFLKSSFVNPLNPNKVVLSLKTNTFSMVEVHQIHELLQVVIKNILLMKAPATIKLQSHACYLVFNSM